MAHAKRSVFHRERKEHQAETPVTEARATAKYLRISPKKVRSVVNSIRGIKVDRAMDVLEFSPKKGAALVKKVLDSAVANAINNFELDADNLYVKETYVNEGPRMKRVWPRGRGRADILYKRMAHITVVVEDRSVSADKDESETR
ncbi:MAG TPA: 50S ribosomal protein L22 [Thermotogota bacterium]|nr:50S ribosomal protein L22 [Thermotogota bacterium]HPJ88174.1 50S ribosomal protein L22 [Thermotogota bacterium]HPR95607.1 50S ribosomal protein L22 [Thermotogota bacterium]